MRRGMGQSRAMSREGRQDREALARLDDGDNADGYKELIRSTIFPGILDRGIDGLFRLDLYRRAGEVETEFMTVMWFTNHEAVVRFAGPDWETAVVPASARAMLSRFEEKAAHYELRVAQEAAPHV